MGLALSSFEQACGALDSAMAIMYLDLAPPPGAAAVGAAAASARRRARAATLTAAGNLVQYRGALGGADGHLRAALAEAEAAQPLPPKRAAALHELGWSRCDSASGTSV